MSFEASTGEEPHATENDSPNRSASPFDVPGTIAPTVSHHLAPSALSDEAPFAPLNWEQIADQLPFGLIILGPGQELRHENASSKELLGISLKEVGSIDGWLAALCPDPQHGKRVAESFHEHVWRNQLTRTFSLKTKPGKLREIEFRSQLQADGGISITLQDVTESLHEQQVQRHGKLKFRALFAGTENGAVLVDHTGRILDANPAFLKEIGLPIREIRKSTFSELLHADDAEALEKTEEDFNQDEAGSHETTLDIRLKSENGEKKTKLLISHIKESQGDPPLTLYLTTGNAKGKEELLKDRLRLVARKAKALLDAVPDLIFLINDDLTVSDFAPPPQAWEELEMPDSWRGQRLAAVWPALDDLVSTHQSDLVENGKIVHANLKSQQGSDVQFAVTLSFAGDGQFFAVVRNDSETRQTKRNQDRLQRAFNFSHHPCVMVDGQGKILAANAAIAELSCQPAQDLVDQPLTNLLDQTSCMLVAQHLPAGRKAGDSSAFQGKVKRQGKSPYETTLEICSLSDPGEPLSFALVVTDQQSDPASLQSENVQHHFRNQLQMVTSLFSLESGDAAIDSAIDSDLAKWQLRLRSVASAIPTEDSLHTGTLIQNIAFEAAQIFQLGPSERIVKLEAEYDPALKIPMVGPMAMLIGELIRLSLENRGSGATPRLYFNLTQSDENQLRFGLFIDAAQQNPPIDLASNETVKLLVAQMRGQISPNSQSEKAEVNFLFPA